MTQQTQEIQKTVAAVLDQTPVQDPPTPPEPGQSPPDTPPQAPSPPAAGGPPAPHAPKTAAKKRKAKKKVRRIVALVLVLALLAGGGFALWRFVFHTPVEQGELLREPVQLGTIQNKAEGSGNAVAKDMAAVTCPIGTVQEVYVSAGDTVMEGDPLYSIYSPTTEQMVKDAEKKLADAQYAIPDAQDRVADAQEALAQAQEKLAQTPQDNQEKLDAAQEKLAQTPQDNQDKLDEAQRAVDDAQEALAERQKELSKLQSSLGELSTTAPFAGKLVSVEDITVGSELAAGSPVATLANDKVMKLSLYFSYAYENSVYVGQKADVSVPAMMLSCPGTVTAVNKINLVSPEGGILFEAVIDVENPGALTEELAATASLTAADGSDILPYDAGKLAYSETVKLETRQAGPVLSKALMQHATVAQGQVLLLQGSDSLDEQIKAKEKEIKSAGEAVADAQKRIPQVQKEGEQALKDAQKAVEDTKKEGAQALKDAQRAVRDAQKSLEQEQRGVETAQSAVPDAEKALEEAQAALEGLNATAPISGSVTSCTINPGDEVTESKTVITISNTAQMTVEIKVTEQNIGFITPGQTVDLTDWNDNMWTGTVTDINMNPSQDDMSSGVTRYSVTLTVDNFDNTLSNGMSLNYSFVTNQVDSCLVVPNQAVKSAVDDDGNEVSVVFIEAESRPDNAVTMPEQSPDMPKKYPTEADGFYAVPVVTGANDTYNVEIRSGLNEGDMVFINYLSASGNSWGMYG